MDYLLIKIDYSNLLDLKTQNNVKIYFGNFAVQRILKIF